MSDLQSESQSYQLKWVKWKGSNSSEQVRVPIVTQNLNGPCPLISIMNVLLLRNRITLPSMMETITASQLLEYLGDCILVNVPSNLLEEEQLNYEQNMSDAMAILPKLSTGLDVNVKFSGPTDFEYTPELIFFDLLRIPLYHGWVVDPSDLKTSNAVGNHSYNQLVDKIITNRSSSSPELEEEANICERFLEQTASQLTYYGLSQLTNTLKQNEICVFFRNNHFVTLHKHDSKLYQLVTDQGFLNESAVVWETLNNIDNDGEFVDGDFQPVPPKAMALSPEERQLQVDHDYLIALSLDEEQTRLQIEWDKMKEDNPQSDEELARKLEEEERRKFDEYISSQEKQAPQSFKDQLCSRANKPQTSLDVSSQNVENDSTHKRGTQRGPMKKNSSKCEEGAKKCVLM